MLTICFCSTVLLKSWLVSLQFRWRQEKARFQGIGDCEFAKYNMNELPPSRLGNFAGNS